MKNILFAENSKALCPVWLEENPKEAERFAAAELAEYLYRISGARFDIIYGGEKPQKAIVLTSRADMANEESRIKADENGLRISGGVPRGLIYGVHSFLEQLGCRWFTAGCEYVPKQSAIELMPRETSSKAVFEYREILWPEAQDGTWAVRNKINGTFADIGSEMGGHVVIKPYVHTFDEFIPAEKYFDDFPEYFSFADGRRIKEKSQLCLSNSAVLELMIKNVSEFIDENPHVNIVSVSQNDCYNPCQCEECEKIDSREESHAGSLIAFINKIAEAFDKSHPGLLIGTLAYQYTRKAPKYIKPHKNVRVWLSTIECCFAHSLNKCRQITSFRQNIYGTTFQQDLQDWSRLTRRLFIWDYGVNYSHYLMPFPNFNVLAENIRYYKDNGVVGIYFEGAPTRGGKTEFAELRSYVLAKLLWNPYLDTNSLAEEFIRHYYENSSKAVFEYYLHLQNAPSRNEDIHFGIFDPPTPPLFTESWLDKAEALLTDAFMQANSPVIKERVELVYLGIEYWRLYIMPPDDENRKEMLDVFFARLKKLGIWEITEDHSLEQSRKLMNLGQVWRHRKNEGINAPPLAHEL